jgi:sulfur-oxidizing protein SoxY
MRDTRRQFLKSSGGLMAALAAAGFLPGQLRAEEWNKAAFESKKLEELVKALGGGAPAQSEAISIVAAEIAENGAAVPIGIVAKLPEVQAIAIAIEKNPNMLAAVFDIPKGTHADILTRVKMAETSNVYALVKAGGKFYYASKEIKVTLGGCGG